MNLKEAFRYQNAIQSMLSSTLAELQDRSNILKVSTTHFRSKVRSDDQDVTIEDNANSEYAGKANLLVEFASMLLAEKEKLTKAIHTAKISLEVDMDGEVALNQERQRFASTLRAMTGYKSSEVILPNGGSGFCFNREGNQVAYHCEAKRVTTIDFDRNKVRALAAELGKKSDGISAELDKCMVNTEVSYEAPFDVNDNFDAVFSKFIENQAKD